MSDVSELLDALEAAHARIRELEAPGECASLHKLRAEIAALTERNGRLEYALPTEEELADSEDRTMKDIGEIVRLTADLAASRQRTRDVEAALTDERARANAAEDQLLDVAAALRGDLPADERTGGSEAQRDAWAEVRRVVGKLAEVSRG